MLHSVTKTLRITVIPYDFFVHESFNFARIYKKKEKYTVTPQCFVPPERICPILQYMYLKIKKCDDIFILKIVLSLKHNDFPSRQY